MQSEFSNFHLEIFFIAFYIQSTYLLYLHLTLSNVSITSRIQEAKRTYVGNATICNIHEGRTVYFTPLRWRVKLGRPLCVINLP